jgi:hypothetical protein
MRRGALVTTAVVLVLAASACGGGGDKTFEADGIGVTFAYPSELKPSSKISFAQSAGAEAVARAGVALDSKNAIIVSRYALRATITKGNLAEYKGEVDRVIGQLTRSPVSGRQVDYGGLPGYEYEIRLASPPQGQSRMVVLFDRRTEYLINCQSTPSRRDALEAACRMALDTLSLR